MTIISLQNQTLRLEIFSASFDRLIWSDLVPGIAVVSTVAANGVPAVTGITAITAIAPFPGVAAVSVVVANGVSAVISIVVITVIALFPTPLDRIGIKKSI